MDLTRCHCGNPRNVPGLKCCSACFNAIDARPVTVIVDGQIRRAVEVVHPARKRFPGVHEPRRG